MSIMYGKPIEFQTISRTDIFDTRFRKEPPRGPAFPRWLADILITLAAIAVSAIPGLQGTLPAFGVGVAEFGGYLGVEYGYTGKVNPIQALALGLMTAIPGATAYYRGQKKILFPIENEDVFFLTLSNHWEQKGEYYFRYGEFTPDVFGGGIGELETTLGKFQKLKTEMKESIEIVKDIEYWRYLFPEITPRHHQNLIDSLDQAIYIAEKTTAKDWGEYTAEISRMQQGSVAGITANRQGGDVFVTKKLYKVAKTLTETALFLNKEAKLYTITDIIQNAGKVGFKITGNEAWVVAKFLKNDAPQVLGYKLQARLILSPSPENLLRLANKANRLISMANPSVLLGRVADKLFEPIRVAVQKVIKEKANKLYNAIKKFNRIAIRRIEGGAIVPTPKSSCILGLRMVIDPKDPLKHRVWIEWIKPGYESTPITPSLSTLEIEKFFALSAGREYHKYRRQYGFDKNLIGDGNARLILLGEQLGFIPDAWLSLGVSLIANIRNLTLQLNKWNNIGTYVKEELIEKMGEAVAGDWGKELSKRGFDSDWDTFDSWIGSKTREFGERYESGYRKASKQVQGKIGAITSIQSIK